MPSRRSGSREYRRYTDNRSRSCDQSRTRHYNRDDYDDYEHNLNNNHYSKSRKRAHRRNYDGSSARRKHARVETEFERCYSSHRNYDDRGYHDEWTSDRNSRKHSSRHSRRSGKHGRRRHRHDDSYSSSVDDGYRSLEAVKPPKCDEEGHLVYKNGDMLQGRYELLTTLGEGAFGRVIKCIDHDRGGRKIALKVIKNVKKYREESKLEIKVLETIIDLDRKERSGCIFLMDWFDYHGFMCLAFDLMGKSIFDFLKDNDYRPYPHSHVQKIAMQLGSAVKFLHDHELTHTDLKPENILFVDSSYDIMYNKYKDHRDERILRSCEIKLIDFGSATFDDQHHTKIVQTRHYRAPEVVLELGWSQSCDVWSVGCILFEIFTGETMFLTHDNHEHLAMMEYILGRLPSSMIKRTKKTKYFYHGRLNWDFEERNSSNSYIKSNCKPLSRCILKRESRGSEKSRISSELLLELIRDCLCYEPEKRTTMSQYLKHQYFDTPAPSISSSYLPTTQHKEESHHKH